MSVRPHGITRLSLVGFPWNNGYLTLRPTYIFDHISWDWNKLRGNPSWFPDIRKSLSKRHRLMHEWSINFWVTLRSVATGSWNSANVSGEQMTADHFLDHFKGHNVLLWLPYILESNPHPKLIRTRLADLLNEKKKLVRGSNPHLSFNCPLPTRQIDSVMSDDGESDE